MNLLLIAALVVVLVLNGGGSSGPGPSRDRAEVEVPSQLQRELAQRFRPVLLFDSAEPWRPLNVDRFFDEAAAGPGQRLCDRGITGPGRCQPITTSHQFEEAIAHYRLRGANLYVDIAGDKANGLDYQTPSSCPRMPPLSDCNDGPNTAIYYNVVGANGRFYVDYWWFLRYNDFPRLGQAASCDGSIRILCSDHEGDWEGVTVVTSAQDPEQIEYVAYGEHAGVFRYAAPQLELAGPDHTRPPVYVAEGTHASYPSACTSSDCRQLARTIVHRPEGRHNGLAAWGRNSGPACAAQPVCLVHLPPPTATRAHPSWNAYTGVWGWVCETESKNCPVAGGPRSPSQQDRYLAPWCAQIVALNGQDFDQHQSCDVTTPGTGTAATPGLGTAVDCRAWSGPSVAVSACDANTLAQALASDQGNHTNTIAIRVGQLNGQTATPGVSQIIAKPLRAPADISIRGQATEITVRARQPAAHAKDLVEARFSGLSLRRGQTAVARVRYRKSKVRVSLRLPTGELVRPAVRRFR